MLPLGMRMRVTEEEKLVAEFERHRPYLHAIAFRVLGSHADADDAVQEAWLRLARAGGGSIQDLRGWLTIVTGRICLDLLRRRGTRATNRLRRASGRAGPSRGRRRPPGPFRHRGRPAGHGRHLHGRERFYRGDPIADRTGAAGPDRSPMGRLSGGTRTRGKTGALQKLLASRYLGSAHSSCRNGVGSVGSGCSSVSCLSSTSAALRAAAIEGAARWSGSPDRCAHHWVHSGRRRIATAAIPFGASGYRARYLWGSGAPTRQGTVEHGHRHIGELSPSSPSG
jgi:hypothetical protein